MNSFPILLAQEAVTDSSGHLFFGLENDERFVVLLTLIACVTVVLIGIVSSVYYAVVSIHRRNAEYNLKQDMLDRGMSAEDIAKVIEASAPPEDATSRWIDSWCKSRKKAS